MFSVILEKIIIEEDQKVNKSKESKEERKIKSKRRFIS